MVSVLNALSGSEAGYGCFESFAPPQRSPRWSIVTGRWLTRGRRRWAAYRQPWTGPVGHCWRSAPQGFPRVWL